MNRSSNGFLPVVYGFMPTVYMLSVIERERVNANQSSNGFVPSIYDFCKCRVPYSTLRGQDTLHNQVRCYVTMIRRYVIDVRADPYQTNIKTIYGYAGSHATSDGDLQLSTENEQNVIVPSLMTPTVVEPYAPTVLESLKPSESDGAPDFVFAMSPPSSI